MSSIAKTPSDPDVEPVPEGPVATQTPAASGTATRPRRSPSKNRLTPPPSVPAPVTRRPSRSRMTPSRPKMKVWTNLLVEAGVIDSISQLGTRVFRSPSQPELLGLTITGRGRTALEAAQLLATHLELASVEVMAAADADLIVVLADALGPRKGTVTCDIVIPRPLWEVTDACRAASRRAAETNIPVMTLRRSALGDTGTLLSLLIAPEEVDPPYDVACAAAQMIDVLRPL